MHFFGARTASGTVRHRSHSKKAYKSLMFLGHFWKTSNISIYVEQKRIAHHWRQSSVTAAPYPCHSI